MTKPRTPVSPIWLTRPEAEFLYDLLSGCRGTAEANISMLDSLVRKAARTLETPVSFSALQEFAQAAYKVGQGGDAAAYHGALVEVGRAFVESITGKRAPASPAWPAKKPKRTVHERILDADQRGNEWLSKGNDLREAGKLEQAEKAYEKGQYWLDLSNKLRGNA